MRIRFEVEERERKEREKRRGTRGSTSRSFFRQSNAFDEREREGKPQPLPRVGIRPRPRGDTETRGERHLSISQLTQPALEILVEKKTKIKPDLGGAVDAGALLEFLSSGRDLLVALSPESSPDLRALAEALGADAEPQGSHVLSPAACAEGDAGYVLGETSGAPGAVVGRKSPSSPSSSVAFPRTTAFTLPRPPAPLAPGIGAGVASAGATPRAFAIVSADEAAFSTSRPASDDAPPAAGRALALAVGVQALSGGRAVLSGSSDALADEAASSLNGAFVSAVSAWAFKDAGALRASQIRHSLLTPLPAALNGNSADGGHRWGDAPYRVGDEIRVEVDVEEADGRGGWRPFEVPEGDEVQVEYRMLDPFVRTALRPVPSGNGTLSAVLKAPDVYGVFKLGVHFVRPGLTPLHVEAVAPLRPFRHDEFDRFLMAAAPYYATLFSVSVAFFAVVGVALYSE